MKILVNGEAVELPAPLSVAQLLSQIGLGSTLVAVERNRDIVPRKEHAHTALVDGDELEIVHFVGGG
jgi:sulfur carrier protein